MEIVINKLINQFTKEVSRYTHGDSTWLIFSESKQWVIELTGSKTLWYNYNFFQEIFHYASLDVVQNQHLITKWVEDNIINETKRTNGRGRVFNRRKVVESVIENGVKETKISPTHTVDGDWLDGDEYLDNIIENGVKETNGTLRRTLLGVDDIIQNGVKETKVEKRPGIKDTKIEDTIENGVKETQFNTYENKSWVEGVVKKGVKMTSSLQSREYTGDIDEALQKGVKRTMWANYADPSQIDEAIEGGVEETNWANHADPDRIDEIIEGGIKEIKKLNENVVNCIDDIIEKDVEEVKPRQDDVTKSEKRYLNNIIENGIKETSHRQYLKTYDVKDTIQDGTEHDYWVLDGCDTPVDKVIENGIEEIYEVDWDVPNYVIEEVISEGVKNSNPLQYMPKEIINNVVENGITSTHDDIYHHRGRVDGVIKNGIKETRREICEYKETVEYIIQTGIKETEPQDDWVNTVRIVTEVIDNGIKKPTD